MYVLQKDLAHALVGPFRDERQAAAYVHSEMLKGASSTFQLVHPDLITDYFLELHGARYMPPPHNIDEFHLQPQTPEAAVSLAIELYGVPEGIRGAHNAMMRTLESFG
jgi:hypothetical protein